MEFECVEDVSPSVWDSLVREANNSYVFHTPIWARILHEYYGHRIATRLYVVDGMEILIPMMEERRYGIRIHTSLPNGYGGIISREPVPAPALDRVIRHLARSSVITILSPPPIDHIPPLQAKGVEEIKGGHHYTHVLKMGDDYDYLFNSVFKKQVRTCIRKAEKNGVTVEISTDAEGFAAFHAMYGKWADKLGNPRFFHSLQLFELLRVIGSPYITLRLARKEGTVIGGIITARFNGNINYLYTGTVTGYKTYCPTHLLLSEVIRSGIESGDRYFDFGSSGELTGLQRFKESFGGKFMPLHQYIITSSLGRSLLTLRSLLRT